MNFIHSFFNMMCPFKLYDFVNMSSNSITSYFNLFSIIYFILCTIQADPLAYQGSTVGLVMSKGGIMQAKIRQMSRQCDRVLT